MLINLINRVNIHLEYGGNTLDCSPRLYEQLLQHQPSRVILPVEDLFPCGVQVHGGLNIAYRLSN